LAAQAEALAEKTLAFHMAKDRRDDLKIPLTYDAGEVSRSSIDMANSGIYFKISTRRVVYSRIPPSP
jgi:hypothetical protein